ncbi:VanZ family protein [Eubacteriaceae bacterium ES3]|nr:VanZ family protein [Eubacteriaceae bacterium ES3]
MIKNNRARFMIKLVFFAYLIGLFMMTLLPDSSNITYETTYNLVPITSIDNFFYDIVENGIINWDYLATNPTDIKEIIMNVFTSSFINLFGNILLFVPLGLLYPLSRKKKVGFLEIFLVCLGTTALIEVIQFLFLTSRRADIDDIILNLIGGLIGYLIYKWME